MGRNAPIDTKQKFSTAVRHFDAGRLAETETLCREILRRKPDCADALVLLAVVLCLADEPGKRRQAIAFLERALRIAPRDSQTLEILGDAFMANGELDAAIDAYRRAISHAPARAKLYSKLGIALNDGRRHDEAIAAYRDAIARDAEAAQAYFNLGVALADAGQRRDAIMAFEQAIARRPNDAAAYVNIAGLYSAEGQPERAIDALRVVARLDPDNIRARFDLAGLLHEVGELAAALDFIKGVIADRHDLPEAHLVHGNILFALQRLAEAKDAFSVEIEHNPGSAAAHNNLGAVLQDLGSYDEAEARHRHALALDPGHLRAYINLGAALQHKGDLAGANAAYDRALALGPTNPISHAKVITNIGIVAEQEGEHERALALHRRALAIDPSSAKIHFNLAVNLLRIGDLAAGWDEYEWRWKGGVPTLKMPNFSQPMWDGSPLNGRTLLLHSEQGLGDTLQFARYLGPLAQTDGRIVLLAPAPLKRILQRIEGVTVLGTDEPRPAFHLHMPLMSLARVLKTRLDTIPAAVPYISAEPADIGAWRARIGDGSTLKVGVVWSGNPKHKYDHQRSIPAADLLAALNIPGVRLFSLQKGAHLADRAVMARMEDNLVDLAPDLGDFGDTAAAICALDLVISVDTSVTHLAGALGRPVWTLLPFTPDWRWLLGREDSPWYPTMRLFRQDRRNDWTGVFAKLRAGLHALMIQAAPLLPELPHLAISPSIRAAIDIVEAARAGRGCG